MRTTSLVLLSLATASVAVAKPSSAEGGSIEALLERISQRQNATSASSAKVSHVPDHPRNATTLPPTPPPEAKEVEQPKKKEDKEAAAPKEGGKHESKRSHNKMAKRVRAKAEEELDKRYVWANSIIQDDTPALAVPAVGENANLLNGATTVPVNTPKATLVAPSFPPKADATQAKVAAPAVSAKTRPHWYKAQARDLEHEEKRWIQSNVIIQDDTPAESIAPAHTTPAANTFVAPSFAPKPTTTTTPAPAETTPAAAIPVLVSGVDSIVVAPLASAVSSAAAPAHTTSAHTVWYKAIFSKVDAGFSSLFHLTPKTTTVAVAAQATATGSHEKRYVWSNQIIQDGDADAPAVGANANLLTSSAAPLATPTNTLVAPSFPPVASSSQAPKILAASSAAASPAAETSAPAAAAAANPKAPTNARASWKQAHDAALAAAAAKKAAVVAPAAAASSTGTAAQKWYKASSKERMVKRER